MAKDYFQDIVPPSPNGRRSVPVRRVPVEGAASQQPEEIVSESEEVASSSAGSDRSIRNVNITPSRPRRPMGAGVDGSYQERRPRRGKRWMWIIAGISAIALALLLLVALRATTVTVTPRTHAVVFDQTSQFTAYPSDQSTNGALPYSVKSVALEDSEVITSAGVVHAEDKSVGQVTVFNDYVATPLTLIKNTRFATAEGLIFRAPADIVVPAKSGANPGKVTVTVIADQAGAAYNIGANVRLTVPGLKSAGAEYTKVYGQSVTAFAGGLVGDKPGVSQADMEKAVAGVRIRLETKARDAARALASNTSVVFSDLTQITYEDLPSTPETGNEVRIHERAHVVIPLFPADAFAHAVARSVSSDADTAAISIVPGEGYGAHLVSASSTPASDPLQFSLIGNATILWNVDGGALAKALAGKDQGAFQTIVTGFPGVQEAHARIEPFWSGFYPKDPNAIKVKILNPTS